jgi:hypothetical protein
MDWIERIGLKSVTPHNGGRPTMAPGTQATNCNGASITGVPEPKQVDWLLNETKQAVGL